MTKGDSQNEQEFLASATKAAHIEGQTDIFDQLEPIEAKPPAPKQALSVKQVVAIRLQQKGNQ